MSALANPGANSGGLAKFYSESKWQLWLQHFLTEAAHHCLPFPQATDAAACIEYLKGADAELSCLIDRNCPYLAHSMLEAVDHANIAHSGRACEAGALQDIESCTCGYLYLNTGIGKARHTCWCERLGALRSSAGPAPAPSSKVMMLQLTSRTTISADNKTLSVADLVFHAHECGATYGGHSRLCFWLSSTAPDTPPSDGLEAVSREHGDQALARKALLGPAASQMCSENFAAPHKAADTPVFVTHADQIGPIAVARLDNHGQLSFLVFHNKDCASSATVTVLLNIGEHFQRLYRPNHQATTLASLTTLHSSHADTTTAPVPSACPVRQLLDWCDDFAPRWRAQFVPPPPSPTSSQQGTQESSHGVSDPLLLSPNELASHNRLWTFLPYGIEEQWLDSARFHFQAFSQSHHDNDFHTRGLVLDDILRHPARTLGRTAPNSTSSSGEAEESCYRSARPFAPPAGPSTAARPPHTTKLFPGRRASS